MTWPPPLPNLPKLLPGETLYSWSGFVHAENAVADCREMSRRLYGAPYSALLHDFPANLERLDRNLGGRLGPSRTLALRHTLLGYFLPAVSSLLAETILSRTLVGAYSDIKLKLGIPASRVGGAHPLKCCSACMEEDNDRYQRAYWHVEHQYPSVLVCPWHRRPVRFAQTMITPVHRRGWILPTLGLERDWVELPQLSDLQRDRLASLAHHSLAWSRLEPGSLDAHLLARTYRRVLAQDGLVTSGGSLRLGPLVTRIRTFYDGLETLPGLASLGTIHRDWPGLAGNLARSEPRSTHPLKHLLLINLLFRDWAEFEATYRFEASGEAAQTDEPQTVLHEPSRADDERMQAFRGLVETGYSVTAASKELKITTTTGVRWATVMCLPFAARPKTVTPEVKQHARALLRKGEPKEKVSRASGLSKVSIDRLISSEPDLGRQWHEATFARLLAANRARFTEAIRAHPDWTLKEVRSLRNSGYAWLYRNDKPWLLENLPSLWAAARSSGPE